MNIALQELFCRHAAAAMEKQLHFGQVIGERAWAFAMDTGLLSFNSQDRREGSLAFPAQVLGSEAEAAGTWLWSWANTGSNIPEPLLQSARQLRALGQQHSIEEFVAPSFLLDVVDGHRLSMTATGILGAHAYYRGPYPGGAVFLLIPGGVGLPPALDAMSFVRLFVQLISNVEVPDHRLALRGYAEHHRLPVCEEDNAILVQASGAIVRAEFDKQRRLKDISTRVEPGSE